MPNILLPPYGFDVNAFVFPEQHGAHYRKIIFQCEFDMFHDNGDVEMEVIAYACSKKGNAPSEPWVASDKVTGVKLRNADPNDPDETVRFNPFDPLALGNNETPVWKQLPLGETSKQQKDQSKTQHQLNRIFSGEKDFIEFKFNMKSRIYKKNLHIDYVVTFSDGTATATNPCPPNQPGEPSAAAAGS